MPISIPPELDRFVDLDRYPIHDLDSEAGRELIADARAMMARDTLVVFPGFLRPPAVRALAAELSQLEPRAHPIDYPSTPYGWLDNSGFAPEHPRSALFRRNCGTITTDAFAERCETRALFHCDELTEFVRLVLGYDTLYRSACPTLAIQVNIMREGEQFGWHFDTNDGVVSLTIQNADRGGGFEYVPLIRDEDDENYDGIARVFSGEHLPRTPVLTEGTLSLFLGRRSLHRVAPVGPTAQSRMSLLFSYDRAPGMVFPRQSCERITSTSNEPFLGRCNSHVRDSHDVTGADQSQQTS